MWPRTMTAAERASGMPPVDNHQGAFDDVLEGYPRFWPLSTILTHWSVDNVTIPEDEGQVRAHARAGPLVQGGGVVVVVVCFESCWRGLL